MIWIIIAFVIISIPAYIFFYSLCKIAHDTDEELGYQEWQKWNRDESKAAK